MAPKFNQNDVTPRVDFSKPIDYAKLQGLNALITGGANGLGAAITQRLCAAGAFVTIADNQAEAGKKLADELRQKGLQATFIHTDVTDWQSQVNAFKTAIQHSPEHRLDLVVPCAGTPGLPFPIQENVSLDEDPPPPPSVTLEVTLKGVYYSTCLAVHYFRLPAKLAGKARRKQQILFIGSLAGYIEVPPVADYNAAKFGVRGLWKSIRREIRDMGIRTNLIAPTFMPTIAIQQVASALEERGAVLGKVDDVVKTAMRLASSDQIDGRAVACGGFGNFDLRDDYEGLDGGVEVLEYFKTGAMNGGMHHFKDILGGRKWS